MSVIRVEHPESYTVMTNYHLRDPRLSLRAIGLMSQMLSNVDTYEYSVAGLYATLQEGRDVIRKTLKELEDAGYLERVQTREGGQFGKNDYVLHQKSVLPLTEKPTTVEPTTESPTSGNPPQRNTKYKEILKEEDIPPIAPQALAELKTLHKDAPDCARAIIQAAGPSAALLDAWCGYIETRRRKRAPIKTLRTVELLTHKLDSLSGGSDERRIEILNQSVERGWTGLFPIGEQTAGAEPESYWAPDPDG